MAFCNQDIFIKPFVLVELLPFVNVCIENLYKDILNTITASSLKLGQLIVDGQLAN